MPKKLIRVTKKDIEAAKFDGDAFTGCLIATVLKRRRIKHQGVALKSVFWSYASRTELPGNAQEAILAWCNGARIKPFNFYLEVPSE